MAYMLGAEFGSAPGDLRLGLDQARCTPSEALLGLQDAYHPRPPDSYLTGWYLECHIRQ
jgi:hypothetical protein